MQANAAPCWVYLHNVLDLDIAGTRTSWARVEQDIGENAGIVSVCSAQERERLLDQKQIVRRAGRRRVGDR